MNHVECEVYNFNTAVGILVETKNFMNLHTVVNYVRVASIENDNFVQLTLCTKHIDEFIDFSKFRNVYCIRDMVSWFCVCVCVLLCF